MGSILNEYISKGMDILDLQNELQRLIKEYNKLTNRYIFVYAADINKGRTRGIDVSLVQDDFYVIQDALRENTNTKIDFYIETPGGSGEAAEEIAKFLRKKFDEVNFVIAGEAKSAGTILVLSGDNIYMTETGSLGPIDAQIKIGRSIVSAHDYKAWIDEKKEEAEKNGNINPLDAIMIAQISPGELYGAINSLEFAKDMVKEWLEKYKFKNWKKTRTSQRDVTDEMRRSRAEEVAEKFCDHTTWRTHGRSLKIEDLEEVLIIEQIDANPDISDIVYRIKTILRMIFDSSSIYKLYFMEDFKLSKTFVGSSNGIPNPLPQSNPLPNRKQTIDGVEIVVNCPKCHKSHIINGYLDIDSNIIKQKKLKTNPNIKGNDILICDNCKFAQDLKPIKSQIETQSKRKLTFN